MRYYLFLTCMLVSVITFAQHKKLAAFIKALPKPAMAVNDFSRLLTPGEKQYLEKEVRDYLRRTTNAIVIITLDSLTDPKTKEEHTVEETALSYFNKWGIGDKVKNNGVLLLVSKQPHRVRITVGKGLDTLLTDAICQQIIDEELVPNFKQGLFYDGLKNTVIELEHHIDEPVAADQTVSAADSPTQPYQPETVSPTPQSGSAFFSFISGLGKVAAGVLGFIFVVFLGVIRMFIGGGGGMFSRNGYYNNSNHYYDNDRGNDSFFSGGGSSSSGGGSSSPGSFGGGSSSGGGASGSW